ncbi:MAG: 50S ribosomal protein L4 [Immundisolibacteraceae bacterium]|nr:50S ribosomal protein L4 [Immundisolibacteraceae bacterium]
MELSITGIDGSKSGTIELGDSVVSSEFNPGLIHQLVTAYLSNARGDTVGHLSRSDVVGSGRKPWRQKGMGKARAGTVKSPLWRGGGKTFVHDERHHQQKVNRKMHRAGMRSILAELIRQERLVVVDSLKPETPKTGAWAAQLATWGLTQDDRYVSVLLVDLEFDEKLYLASRNIPKVTTCTLSQLGPVDLVGNEKVVITADALKSFEERL